MQKDFEYRAKISRIIRRQSEIRQEFDINTGMKQRDGSTTTKFNIASERIIRIIIISVISKEQ